MGDSRPTSAHNDDPESLLKMWRAGKRELDVTPPESPFREWLAASVDELAEAYRAAVSPPLRDDKEGVGMTRSVNAKTTRDPRMVRGAVPEIAQGITRPSSAIGGSAQAADLRPDPVRSARE
jgi:hypothetical protein